MVLRVEQSVDLVDEPRLHLGVLGFDFVLGGDNEELSRARAKEVLSQRGNADRTNKNACLLVVADGPALAKARATARTIVAMKDLKKDKYRLNRFNAEQREQLDERLRSAESRLPQQMVMCYRHLMMLAPEENGASRVEHVDLGPARVDANIPGRVFEHLLNTDRILETTLAPAALLSSRFGVLPDEEDAVELPTLLSYFYRLPRLPKLTSEEVLRRCLVEGVAKKVFGLASGSSWDADDAVLRFGVVSDPSEIQFQPGIHLVRAAAVAAMIAKRPSDQGSESPPPEEPTDAAAEPKRPPVQPTHDGAPPATVARVVVSITGVPPDKAREVLKTAIMPLAAESAEVSIDYRIEAVGGSSGIPRNTLDLVVREGLKQLGLSNVEITELQD